MQGERARRVGDVIQQELMRLLQREVHDPRIGFATVTEVRMSPDLRSAKIYVSVLGESKAQHDSIAALQHASGFLRGQIGHALRLRFAPELHFVLDETLQKAIRIEQLLHPDEGKPDEGKGE